MPLLTSLGLSREAEAVYRAMLGHSDHGVAELASGTGLPLARVRSSLDELADLALLKPAKERGVGLRPVSPEIALAPLLANAEAEAATKAAQIEATRAAIAAIAAEYARNREDDGGQRLVGLEAVRSRLEELQRTTTTECLSLNPGSAHLPDAREAAKPLNQQALERGVMIKAVCRDSFRNDPETLGYARWLTELGGQMRTVPTVPIQLVIIDRRYAILPLDPDNPRAGALEARSPAVLAAACALFAQVWDGGTPFGEAAHLDANGCTPAERQLLEIVSAGHADDTAARKLGVSLRTVRRMMADLMARLDATSRFQAGVNAARRGWL
jgi:DNA-binding CsgD family transcriptional regulator